MADDETDAWAAFDEARRLEERVEEEQGGDEIASDDEDASMGGSLLLMRASSACASICRLPNGDIHVCRSGCTLAEPIRGPHQAD